MTSKSILLVCNAGMSSSFLVSRMQERIEDRDLDLSISAVSSSEAERKLKTKQVDYLLLSPQVRYLKPSFEKITEDTPLVISVIDNKDFGTLNADKIIDDLL